MHSFINVCLAETDQLGVTANIPGWKRFLDLLCIILALPVLLPLMGLIALYIKIVSPGPVFYRQERIGYLGRRFNCLKFRSMHHGADTGSHQAHLAALMQSNAPMVKMDKAGDTRLIKGAQFLRSSGLDELPQMINVAIGEMSIVGPRPCTPYEFEQYQPWHKERCQTLPGLTGLWQVSGKNRTTFAEMINLDIFYARNRSLWLDLKIMVNTFSTLAAQIQESRQSRNKASAGRNNEAAYPRANSLVNT